MISFLKSFFFGQKLIPAVFPKPKSLDFEVLPNSFARESVLYDDGWVRVTPGWVQIGDEKKIAVSHIRELRQGLIRDDHLARVVHNLIFYFFFWGMVFCGLLEKWVFFSICLVGLAWVVSCRRRWPYYVSIHASGLWGEYLSFSDPKLMEACGRAIKEAIQVAE